MTILCSLVSYASVMDRHVLFLISHVQDCSGKDLGIYMEGICSGRSDLQRQKCTHEEGCVNQEQMTFLFHTIVAYHCQ